MYTIVVVNSSQNFLSVFIITKEFINIENIILNDRFGIFIIILNDRTTKIY